MARIALVTSVGTEEMGGERELLLAALADAGIEVDTPVWNEPTVEWGHFDGVIIRSTWDYMYRPDEFRGWIDHVAAVSRLANSAPVVTWNCDKRYLADLADAGAPVLDTRFLEPGGAVELPSWPDLVVKPTVSGGGRWTGRFDASRRDAAADLVATIHAEGATAMVQPYVPAVESDGEASVLVFGGEISHAVAKGGILPEGVAAVPDTSLGQAQTSVPLGVDDELSAFVHQVLAVLPGEQPVYARIDSVVDTDGIRKLMEVELIEPYLFLASAADPEEAASHYAAAVARWLTVDTG